MRKGKRECVVCSETIIVEINKYGKHFVKYSSKEGLMFKRKWICNDCYKKVICCCEMGVRE